MKIDSISDLHGHYPELEGGDLLIVAGDLTASDQPHQRIEFLSWFAEQKYKRKIFIAGNHDHSLEGQVFIKTREDGVDYLCDFGIELAFYPDLSKMEEGKVYHRQKFKIWGSPWTLPGRNPKTRAFTGSEDELKAKFDLIQDDTDILITHGPPHGCYLDQKKDGRMMGSVALRDRIYKLKLKLHVFGHVHEGYGRHLECVNCSHVNENYEPVNKPIRIIL